MFLIINNVINNVQITNKQLHAIKQYNCLIHSQYQLLIE